MYIILSHPSYDNAKFKLYKSVPLALRRFAPQVLTKELAFALLYTTPTDSRWRGDRIEAMGMIPRCIEMGGNPLILDEGFISVFNPEPPTTVKLSKKQTYQAYWEILEKVALSDKYLTLHTKLARHITDVNVGMELNEQEVTQLLEVLHITRSEANIKSEAKAVDPYEPPPREPLFDMSQYSEEPEPEPKPEQPMLNFIPSEQILHGQTKSDALRLNRTRRRKA